MTRVSVRSAGCGKHACLLRLWQANEFTTLIPVSSYAQLRSVTGQKSMVCGHRSIDSAGRPLASYYHNARKPLKAARLFHLQMLQLCLKFCFSAPSWTLPRQSHVRSRLIRGSRELGPFCSYSLDGAILYRRSVELG